ncbi:MAG: alpha/beta hydrolase [Bacteroidota bacterium]
MKFIAYSFSCILCCVGSIGNILAQSTDGLTGKRDTSYGNYPAYESTKKTHPFIKLITGFKDPAIVEEKNIVYTSINTRKLLTDVFYPKVKTKTNRIAFIMIHGGGWRSGNRTQHHPLAQKLAALGYVCFTPEYRLSTEALFPASVYDLKAMIRWVRNNAVKYNIDTSRIVAAGFSAGGELAAFLGVTGNMPLFEGTNGQTRTHTNVNAVVDMDGILSFTHPESGEGDDSKRTSAATYWFGYPKKGNEKLWEAGSSLSYVSSSTPPTLFVNSSVDRMHAGREDYIKVLNSYHIYSEIHRFNDAPHSFPLFDPWFEPMVNYIDVFLKKVFR